MRLIGDFYHPEPERFAEICQRIFPYTRFDYPLAQRTVPIPALLNYAGYPLAANQFCFRHMGHGRALWVFQNEHGEWFFKCMDSGCGIKGDVVGMWYLMVTLSGFAPPCWNMDQACGDLMTRAERGMIDLSVTELSGRRVGAKYPRLSDAYHTKLEELVRRENVHTHAQLALPKPVGLRCKQAILGLFPFDGYLLATPQLDWQKYNIRTRDYWLENYERFKLWNYSFISSNYLSRDDVNCSLLRMEGIERRWLVIEDDKLTLEQQFWIHKQLERTYQNLGCVLFSGGRSLHAWYNVEGYSEEQCYALYVEAIQLGVSECNTWTMSQPVRMPQGLNSKTKRKQTVLLWNV